MSLISNSASPRNIILCFDGTGNHLDLLEDGLLADTNVEIFYNALKNTENQKVKYVAGIGHNPNVGPREDDSEYSEEEAEDKSPTYISSIFSDIKNAFEPVRDYLTNVRQKYHQIDDFIESDPLSKWEEFVKDKLPEFNVFEKITGTGISKRIRIGYKWLAENYQSGDRIYLFGFSRGAYTARSLANLVSLYGLPSVDEVTEKLVESIYQQYRNSKQDNNSPAEPSEPDIVYPIPPIHFLGVWDTVGALGQSVFGMQFNFESFDNSFHDINLYDNIRHAYHALAIDDIRSSFLPTMFQKPMDWKGIAFEQVWFRGAHSDVGGGYADRRLANISLHWMAEKARKAGLIFNEDILAGHPVTFNDLSMHDEYKGKMKLAVSWPRWTPIQKSKTEPEYDPSLGYLHESVFEITRHHPEVTSWKIKELPNIGDSVDVVIDSEKEWNPTGLILRKGHVYHIKAEGIVLDAKREVDANGWYEDSYKKRIPRRIQEANWMELCGTIATQPEIRKLNRSMSDYLKVILVEDPEEYRKMVFRIGKENRIMAGNSGFLWLFLNDNWITYSNNSGSMTITITRKS